MQLSTFLEEAGEGATERLALAIGVNLTTAYRWRNRESIPRKGHMDAIESFTEGKVKAGDFYAPLPPTVPATDPTPASNETPTPEASR